MPIIWDMQLGEAMLSGKGTQHWAVNRSMGYALDMGRNHLKLRVIFHQGHDIVLIHDEQVTLRVLGTGGINRDESRIKAR